MMTTIWTFASLPMNPEEIEGNIEDHFPVLVYRTEESARRAMVKSIKEEAECFYTDGQGQVVLSEEDMDTWKNFDPTILKEEDDSSNGCTRYVIRVEEIGLTYYLYDMTLSIRVED